MSCICWSCDFRFHVHQCHVSVGLVISGFILVSVMCLLSLIKASLTNPGRVPLLSEESGVGRYYNISYSYQCAMCQWSTSIFKSSCGCTALDTPKRREMTKQTDWWAKQPTKWIASWKVRSVEETKTLPVGTKPRTSHHRSPGGKRCRKRKCQMIFLERMREKAIVNQMNIGTVSKAPLGRLLREGVEHIIMGFSEHILT